MERVLQIIDYTSESNFLIGDYSNDLGRTEFENISPSTSKIKKISKFSASKMERDDVIFPMGRNALGEWLLNYHC